MAHALAPEDFLKGMELPPNVDAAIVTFHQKGCPACHNFLPVFDQAARSNPSPEKVLYLTFDLSLSSPKMFKNAPFVIDTVPAIMKYEGGKFVDRFQQPRTVENLHNIFGKNKKESKEFDASNFNLSNMTLKAPHDKGDYIILVYSNGCGHCTQYKPRFSQFKLPNVNFKILDINSPNISEAISSSKSPFHSKFVPTIVSYHNGKFFSKFGGDRNNFQNIQEYASGIGRAKVHYKPE